MKRIGWMGIGVRRVLVLLILLAGPVQARDAALACVQGQLAVLGYSAGPQDGLWGPRSARGADRFRTEVEGAAVLPELTQQNASVWCRQLGLRDPRLATFWPSTLEGAVLVTGLDSPARAEIAVTAQKMLRRFEQRFGLRLAETVQIVAGAGADDLRPLWRAALGGRDGGFDAIYAQSCGATPIGGFTSGNVMALCLPDGATGLSMHNQWLFQTTIAHELFHSVQRQLVGAPGPEDAAQPLAYAGPEWLIEGSANFASLTVTLPDAFIAPSFAELKSRLAGRHAQLRRLETYLARSHDLEALYDNGTYAAYLLAQDAGQAAQIGFYERIGMGTAWESAFAQAFGTTVSDFYANYARGADG